MAHSNQGGKKKQRILLFNLVGRSMPLPTPDVSGSKNGLLMESFDLVMPSRETTWTPQVNTIMIPETGGFNEGSTTGGGIVPAPGALLLLGLAAAGRHRRRRQG